MLLLTSRYKIGDENIDNNLQASFVVLNPDDLSFNVIPYCDQLNSKLQNTSGDSNKPQGRASFRPFGITTDNNYIYIACNEFICSFEKTTFEYKNIISNTGRVNTHQLCHNNGYLYRCDTAINCITKINLNTLEETYIDIPFRRIIPHLYECKYVRDKDLFHINCIYIHNNKLYINAARYIEIKNLSNDGKQIMEHLLSASNEEYDDDEKIDNLKQNYNMENGVENNDIKNETGQLPFYFNTFLENNLETNDILESRIVIYNIDTNTFEPETIKIHKQQHHDIMIINDNIWSLCTSEGSLNKITSSGKTLFQLVEPSKYFLRGMTHKNNIIYAFANKHRDFKYKNVPPVMIIFDMSNETFIKKTLDKQLQFIYQATILS